MNGLSWVAFSSMGKKIYCIATEAEHCLWEQEQESITIVVLNYGPLSKARC